MLDSVRLTTAFTYREFGRRSRTFEDFNPLNLGSASDAVDKAKSIDLTHYWQTKDTPTTGVVRPRAPSSDLASGYESSHVSASIGVTKNQAKLTCNPLHSSAKHGQSLDASQRPSLRLFCSIRPRTNRLKGIRHSFHLCEQAASLTAAAAAPLSHCSRPARMPRRDPIRPAEPLYDTHPASLTFADDVARYVQSFYTDHVLAINKSARPGPNQWTVLAAIVVYTELEGEAGDAPSHHGSLSPFHTLGVYREESAASYLANARLARPHANRLEILTLATGVKCVGGSERSDEERARLVIDMHAEVLARREFELLLLEQMKEALGETIIEEEGGKVEPAAVDDEVKSARRRRRRRRRCFRAQDKEEEEQDDLELPPMPTADPIEPIIELVSNTPPRFRLIPGKRLFLYTSHAPCGPAANAAHLARLDAEDLAMLGALDDRLNAEGVTHAPLVEASSDFRSIKSDPKPLPTKKPSRADAKPTTAYTCSDKLSRYQLLGLQGGRLSTLLERPIRLSGIIVGDDFDEPCLRTLFGGGEEGQYTRLENGVREIIEGGHGGDRHAALAWLDPLPQPSIEIYHSTVPFRFGRYGPNPDRTIKIRDLPEGPDAVERLLEISRLTIPLMRDELLARPTLTPTSLACSYRSGKYAEVLGPSGRVHGVGPHKRTKVWTDEAVSRISRKSLDSDYKRLVRVAVEEIETVGTPPPENDAPDMPVATFKRDRNKGCAGWKTLSSWMEQRGPFADWHKNGGRTPSPAVAAATRALDDTQRLPTSSSYATQNDAETTSSSPTAAAPIISTSSSSSSATQVESDIRELSESVKMMRSESEPTTKPPPAFSAAMTRSPSLPTPGPPLKPRRPRQQQLKAKSSTSVPQALSTTLNTTMTIKIGGKVVNKT